MTATARTSERSVHPDLGARSNRINLSPPIDIIHRSVIYLKHGVSEIGLCLHLQSGDRLTPSVGLI
jgi:hypothetical protein